VASESAHKFWSAHSYDRIAVRAGVFLGAVVFKLCSEEIHKEKPANVSLTSLD
jgi:hypothetical protein